MLWCSLISHLRTSQHACHLHLAILSFHHDGCQSACSDSIPTQPEIFRLFRMMLMLRVLRPYHSSSVESVVANIRGVKIAYPSNGADLKGLIKAAYHDPNPVVILEHKGLYWSKIKGTEGAMTIEPDEDYVIPFGKARTVQTAEDNHIKNGTSITIITYGMGVYWATKAAKDYKGQVEIIDLRTLNPLDKEAMFAAAKKHGRVLVLTEESIESTFSLGLVARIQKECFEFLDAPIELVGSVDTPAIPLNSILEETLLPNAKKVSKAIEKVIECKRIGVTVIGLEVPHAHIHLIPINGLNDMNFSKKTTLSEEEFIDIANQIKNEIQEFTPHVMYNSRTGESIVANNNEEHISLAQQGWTHEQPVDNNND